MPTDTSTLLVQPFVGERFTAHDRLQDLIAPPYDVITPAARDTLARGAAHNIVRLILPEGNGDKYARAASLVDAWREAGILTRDPAPSVYVIQQEFRTPAGVTLTRTGVIAAVAVEPFAAGRVKPHERTHPEPKADRLALLRSTGTVFDALLFLARDIESVLQGLLSEAVGQPPLCVAEGPNSRLVMWRVSGSAADAISAAASSNALYIADGHHRYETALAYRQERAAADRTLGLIVPLGDPGLVVLPTHRMIRGSRIDVDRVLENLRDWFQLHELPPNVSYVESLATMRERGTTCVVVHRGGNALELLLKQDAKLADLPFATEPTVATLDVARIDELVVKRLVEAAGEGAQVGHTPRADEVIDAVLRGDVAAGVLLNPLSVEHVLRVADAGASMPQKATYFYPKVPSGLVFLGLTT
jgi:uncharacterized protein (DUF1015 family)